MTAPPRAHVVTLLVALALALSAAPGEERAAPPQSPSRPQSPAPPQPPAAPQPPIAMGRPDLPAQPSITLPPDLQRVLTDYEAAWSRKDAAGLAQLFAEDGFILPNGGAPVRGRAAIEERYSGSGGPLALRAFAYAAEGGVGYILGGYAPQKGEPDTGKFTLTLRKDAGRWLIMSDMDSPNHRPKAAPNLPRQAPPAGGTSSGAA